MVIFILWMVIVQGHLLLPSTCGKEAMCTTEFIEIGAIAIIVCSVLLQ